MFHKHDIVGHAVTDGDTINNQQLLSLHVMGCERAMQIARRLAVEEAAEGRAVSIVHLVGDDDAGAIYQEVVSA